MRKSFNHVVGVKSARLVRKPAGRKRMLSSAVGAVMEPVERRVMMSTVTLSGLAETATDISVNGPLTSSQTSGYAAIGGSAATANGKSTSVKYGGQLEIVEFDYPQANGLYPGGKVTGATGVTLSLYNTAITGTYAPVGNFDIFLLPNSTTTSPTSGFTFQGSTDPTGLNGQGGATNPDYLVAGNIPAPTTLGNSTYSLTLSADATNLLQTELSNDQPIRFAVTPSSSTSFVDFDGIYGNHTPALSLTATSAPTEQFSVNNSAVTVDETSGSVQIDVSRTGFTSDTATVNYTASGGTAGPSNYCSTSGTISFQTGQSAASISVPIYDASPQGGNETFNVTLSSPTATVATASLGSAVTTTVTIVDTAPLTNNATSLANTVTDIENTGPYTGTTLAPVNGSLTNGTGSFSYQSFATVEFSPATTPSVFPSLGFVASNLQNLTLSLDNSDASTSGDNYAGHPGDFNIYFLANPESTTATNSLVFNTSTVDGVAGQAGAVLLGTFSFSGAAGYDTFTPSSLPATVARTIVSDLNSQTPFRFAVAPGAASFAADWDGAGANGPILSLTDTSTLTGNPETVGFNTSAAPFTVAESAGTITLEVDRADVAGGNLNDTLTVNYTTTNDTALAGTNYGVANGTLTFGPGATAEFITVPVINNAYQGGDKTFTVTLSGATDTASTTQAVLGTTSVLVTVTDTTAGSRETLVSNSSDQESIQSTGPYFDKNGYVYITGNTSTGSSYPSFVTADFNNPDVSGLADTGGQNQGLDTFNPSSQVTQIDSLTLGIVAGGGVSGPVNVYVVPNATANVDPVATSPYFETSAIDRNGVDNGFGLQFGSPMLLGQIQYNASAPANSYTQLPLIGYSQATENALIALINAGDPIRLVFAPGNSTVDAKIDGYYDNDGTTTVESNIASGVYSSSGKYSPTLSITVNEGTVSPLPGYLSANSEATYNPGSNTITVLGPTTFIGDPTAVSTTGYTPATQAQYYVAPNVVAAGTSASISFNTTSGSEVHLASLSLTGGATAAISNPANDPAVLEISSGLTINTGGTLDIGTGDVDIAAGAGVSLSQATALVASGYNVTHGGNWKGTGITSSAAAGNTSHLTAVAVVSDPSTGTFDGDPTATAGDILIKYTYFGDANLSGSVDGSDYSLIDAAYAADKASPGSVTGWANGDFNYDGTVDGSDYALIDNAFNNQNAKLAFVPSALVATSTAAVASPAGSVAKSSGNDFLPKVPVALAAHTARPVAVFRGANNLPPFFSDTPISSGTSVNGSTVDASSNDKAKKSLADSIVDLVG